MATTYRELDEGLSGVVVREKEHGSEAVLVVPAKPPLVKLDLGTDGLTSTDNFVVRPGLISVTLEGPDGTRVILRGDSRSLYEVQYALMVAIEKATRRHRG